jgi:hypothetical protein
VSELPELEEALFDLLLLLSELLSLPLLDPSLFLESLEPDGLLFDPSFTGPEPDAPLLLSEFDFPLLDPCPLFCT